MCLYVPGLVYGAAQVAAADAELMAIKRLPFSR